MSQHRASREWLEERIAEPAKVGLPWHSLLAFVRLVTNQRVFRPPTTTRAAWRQVESWLGQPTVWIPPPTSRHKEVLSELLTDDVRAELVPDAHLAALAIEHGLTVCSTDGDFARFRGVRWENPLSAG